VPHSSRIRHGCPSKSQSAQHFVCSRHCRCCRPQFAELLVALILIYIAASLEHQRQHPPFHHVYLPNPEALSPSNRIFAGFLIHSISLCKQGGQGTRLGGSDCQLVTGNLLPRRRARIIQGSSRKF